MDADVDYSASDGGEDLGALLRRALADAGLSQLWLAQQTGIPKATINAWVTGVRGAGGSVRLDPGRLRLIAEALPGVTVAQVFEAAGRRAPAALDQERERKLLRIYRDLPVDQQRMLIQQAELLAKMSRAS